MEQGRLALFRNFDDYGNPYPIPRTVLIDSEQFGIGAIRWTGTSAAWAAQEIERFRRERLERNVDAREAENITDHDLLREVMNTVGKEGRLGQSIRCVVSVSMLTEGWDANTVTHVLGVRAFGTQLLCEQVVGRALRRQSYDLNDEGLFDVEYARRARRSLRFYSQTGRREACAASPNGTGQSSPARPRPSRNPVPKGVRLPHRPTQGGALGPSSATTLT